MTDPIQTRRPHPHGRNHIPRTPERRLCQRRPEGHTEGCVQCLRASAQAGPQLPPHPTDWRLDQSNRSWNQGHQFSADLDGVPHPAHSAGDLARLRYSGAFTQKLRRLTQPLTVSDVPIRLAVCPHHWHHHGCILGIHHLDHFVAHKVPEAGECCRQQSSHCCC
jgi:hypothetical protein